MITTIPLAILGFLLGCALAAAITYRQRWNALKLAPAGPGAALMTALGGAPAADTRDRALADWTRDTKITVCSVTGTWVSMTLAELANSSVPYRSWNVPTSVEIHPRSMDARTDQDQAKEHRG